MLVHLLCLQAAHAGDRDNDGVPNKSDACREQPEDIDGFQDDDGCPDPSVQVNLLFLDTEGRVLDGVEANIEGEGGAAAGMGRWTAAVHPGPYVVTAQADGYVPWSSQITIPDQASFEVSHTLVLLVGTVDVRVRDEGGNRVPGMVITVDKQVSPEGTAAVRPGDHIVTARAPGFANHMEMVTVKADTTHQVDVVLAPLVRDKDDDGIVDDKDRCPRKAEDFDGFEDIDGCPDPTVDTTFTFVDEIGKPVRGIEARIMGDGGDGKGNDRFTLALHPGEYEVFGTAASFENVDQTVTVPNGLRQHDVRFEMKRIWTTLILYVTDDKGAPIDAFWWSLDHGERSPGDGGGLYSGKMDPGSHTLTISAEGFAPAQANILLEAGAFAETSIMLYPTLIKVTPDKIEIADKIYFDTGKATIKPESFPLLNQVASAMKARTDMLRVRIEGHTDSRGAAGYNRELSSERAISVRKYLMEQGVEDRRLVSIGYGEDHPVDDRNVEDAWEKNRRVEFLIEEWADVLVEKEIAPRQAHVEVKTTSAKPALWPGFGVLDGSPPPLPPGVISD